jgi:ABC-2 type transport system permease protein
MTKILTIFRREFLNLVAKPSFWFGMLVVPIIVGAVVLVIALTSGVAAAASAANKAGETKSQGVIDLSGLLSKQPGVLATQPNLQLLPDEDEARTLLADKRINSYYVVAADFVQSGAVRYVADQFSPLDAEDRTDGFERLLRLALLNGDEEQLKRYEQPVNVTREARLAPEDPRRAADFSPVPIFAAVMFMGSLIGSASYLMQTVTQEKENRVIEVLMSSVTPSQLLTGKILGLGLVGFLQMIMWLGSTMIALPFLSRIPMLTPYLGVITFDAIAWAIVFFVLGYFIYAALMAGVGALMPAAKEAGSYSFFVMLPLVVPIYLNTSITQNPDGPLAVALSLFPLSTPVAMTMRMLSSTVPWWQPALAAVFMLGACALTLKLAARVFRAQSLLRGNKPSFQDVLLALRA